ncbi:Phosphoribosylformylglycinamidine synthase subunit PurL [subsurface metagenome]
MIYLIQVGYKKGVSDARALRTAGQIRDYLGIPVERVETRNLYRVEAELSRSEVELSARELFIDPVVQEYAINQGLDDEGYDYSIIVSFKPGVTDNVGRTAALALADLLQRKMKQAEGVSTAVQYLLRGVSFQQAERIACELLANELIENTLIQDCRSLKNELRIPPTRVNSSPQAVVEEIDLELGDSRLEQISRRRTLALNLKEMRAIRDYFRQKEVRAEREKVGLRANPTDVELEALAQTWSEHCHHKIFNGIIHYTDEKGHKKTIHSLFRTYIKKATALINSGWLLSVFSDNAGVIRYNDRLALVYKVETHNSPSALDPYGGAMTGIVGVNRDPFGTGLGARLIANVWGYCLGNPLMTGPIPQGLLHPRRIRDGVHRGVIEGGNQSGIPYMRGWELFEDRFRGKPLVFCGTLGEMPLEIEGRPTSRKEIRPGDRIVMVGGRVGKDGIHGATFSSEELHASSPVQAVQIGDPITQKKMTDMLLEARDRLLYRALTDNGAGGLSSSVGEMAELAGGCDIDLALVPLKYQGLNPWEILVSEAQERMTLAVSPEKLDLYLAISAKRRVESTVLGRFTHSGYFHIRHGSKTVAYLDLDFLHRGDPPYELEARYERKRYEEPEISVTDHRQLLLDMLRSLNICSGEEKARQYDHEVQGRSVIKPFVGKDFDVPPDAGILLAEYGGREGIILTEGVNPFYSDIDTYWMAASVVDLAVRRVVSAGGDPDFIAGLDNFCWPNVVKKQMPERSHKLAQLVRACEGLYDFCTAFRVPLISGKDSMSNDSTLTDPPISVPPTLLVSVLGKIQDIKRAVTLDVKSPGDLLYMVGETHEELGGSEFYRCYGEKTRGRAYIGNHVPRVGAEKALKIYRRLHKGIQAGLIRSCHTPALGGAGVALAKKAFAGGYGLDVDLKAFPGTAAADYSLLYSESNSRFLITVAPDKGAAFEGIMDGITLARIGRVRPDDRFRIIGLDGSLIIEETASRMKEAWQERLKGM